MLGNARVVVHTRTHVPWPVVASTPHQTDTKPWRVSLHLVLRAPV